MAPTMQTHHLRDSETSAGSSQASSQALKPTTTYSTLLNTFTRPYQTQNASPLLSMPPELRQKVLRNLLKSDGVIPDCSKAISEAARIVTIRPTETGRECRIRRSKWWSEMYHFSSQILACCQQLYHEGRHVLYKENIASIQCETSNYFSVPGCILKIPHKSYSLDKFNGDTDLLSAGQLALKTPSNAKNDNIRQVYPALAEFLQFTVLLEPFDRVDMFMMVRQLRNLLRHKKVLLRFPAESAEMRNIWLKSCRVWRCKEISFAGQTGNLVKGLTKEIMGIERVYDGLDALGSVRDIKTKLNELKGASTQEVRRAYRHLQGAVMKYSERSVVKHKAAFIEAVRKAVKLWEEERIEELKKQQRDVKAGSKKLLGALTQIDS